MIEKQLVFKLVYIIIYIVGIILWRRKIEEIRLNSKKYDKIPNFEEFKKSEYYRNQYWEPSHRDSTGISPEAVLAFFGAMGLQVGVIVLVHLILVPYKIAVHIFVNWDFFMVVYFAIMISSALCISLVYVLFPSHEHSFYIEKDRGFRKSGRKKTSRWIVIQRYFRNAMIAWILTLPVLYYVSFSYMYYNSDSIVIGRPFQIKEEVVSLKDVHDIELVYSDSPKGIGNAPAHVYIHFNSGKSIDFKEKIPDSVEGDFFQEINKLLQQNQ